MKLVTGMWVFRKSRDGIGRSDFDVLPDFLTTKKYFCLRFCLDLEIFWMVYVRCGIAPSCSLDYELVFYLYPSFVVMHLLKCVELTSSCL